MRPYPPHPPKRRPIYLKQPVFSVFHPMGLHFGDHTASNRSPAATQRGNCIIRTPTRRRHAASELLMVQNPHRQPASCATSPTRPGRRADWREKTRPTPPLQPRFREKTRPARHKPPILGHCSCAGRTSSRSHPPSDPTGRKISHTGHGNTSVLKEKSPLHEVLRTVVKHFSPTRVHKSHF